MTGKYAALGTLKPQTPRAPSRLEKVLPALTILAVVLSLARTNDVLPEPTGGYIAWSALGIVMGLYCFVMIKSIVENTRAVWRR